MIVFFFFFNDTATTEIYTLSLHDALPISDDLRGAARRESFAPRFVDDRLVLAAVRAQELGEVAESPVRSEEHTSELQSPCNLVCRLLLEKKKHQEEQSSERAMVAYVRPLA